MKNKRIDKKLAKDLSKIRNILNELVLFSPVKKGDSLENVVESLCVNFLESARRLEFPAKSSGEGKFAGFNPKEDESVVSILKEYLFLFKFCPSGQGFTPKLAISKHEGIGGYNCFGKAMLFASYAMYHKIKTGLAFSVNHTMCVCVDGEDKYLCDPTNGAIHKLYGKFVPHDAFEWYVKDQEKDKGLLTNYLILTSVQGAGLYNIFRTFAFLKNTPWDHTRSHAVSDYDYIDDMLSIMDPKLPYRKLILDIDWGNLVEKVFPYFEEYKKIYSKEWALEIERMRLRGEMNLIHKKFDNALILAVRSSGFIGSIKEFHNKYLPIIAPISDMILSYLNGEKNLIFDLPKSLNIYLEILHNAFEKDAELRDYAIKKIAKKISQSESAYAIQI